MTDTANLRVDCYAGYRGEQTPRRFFLGARAVDVEEVLDRWIAPDHRYFKCRGSDGDLYILRHDVGEGRWELTMFSRGSRHEEPPQRAAQDEARRLEAPQENAAQEEVSSASRPGGKRSRRS